MVTIMQDKWIVGVDLGGTTTKLAFINMDGEILYKGLKKAYKF